MAVYGGDVEFDKKGKYAVLAATKKSDGTLTGATGQIEVSTKNASPIPAVGDKAPKVDTETLESAKGDIVEDRHARPPSDMHEGTSPTSSARSRSRCCSLRRSYASRACAAP